MYMYSNSQKDADNLIGIQITLFEPGMTGKMHSIWLPGGMPQGRYGFEGSVNLEEFTIDAYNGIWYAVCKESCRFINCTEEEQYYVALKDHQLLILRKEMSDFIIYVEEITADRGKFNNYKTLYDSDIRIGRHHKNDVQYDMPFVSGNHALLEKQKDGWLLKDLDSLNGTYVNGVRVKEKKVSLGDVIYIVGLRIIIGTDFLSINDDGRPVYIQGEKFSPYQEQYPLTYQETTKGLKNYFERQPRRKNSLSLNPIIVDAPPMSMNGNKMPLLLRMGGSMVMGTTAMMAGHFTTMLSSVLFPVLSQRYTEKERKEYEERRVTAYTQYLSGKENEIETEKSVETQNLNKNDPSIEEVIEFTKTRQRLWERQRADDDFLKVRAGHGEIPMMAEIKYPEERFSIDEDELEQKMRILVGKKHTLYNVPICISLMEDFVLGMTGDESLRLELMKRMIVQLSILHSYDEVKIVLLANEQTINKISEFRYIPHVWNNQKSFRFIASTSAQAYQLGEYLKKEIEEDLEGKIKLKDILKKRPYYVVFALDKKIFDSLECLKSVLQEEENRGISILAAFEDLPKECSKIIQLNTAGEHEIVPLRGAESEAVWFRLDQYPEQKVKESAKNLANTNIKVVTESYSLPKSLSFLEMFGVGKIEHLNVLSRWKDNNPVNTLAVPVGVGTDGSLFNLDLHEKFQGPHGLIAGMTGSGKSEFIISYILSLAVNFHPDEVAFILIDYKGGGLAGAFDDRRNGIHLPHLMGTITNLDGSEIQRSLVSIQSELLRRQRLFNEVKSQVNEGTMDIYSYQKLYRNGKVTEPVPHLFIISDEFAELKKQQPEFMDQLISAARIGRSLGVHLILATQKPTGVVNEQILSNTKFRVCLKVQDRSDSMEMLRRPEAAELKNIGSFYLQVGYNEFFALGQSAWSGAAYEPSDEIKKNIDDTIQFLDMVGQTVHSARKQERRVKTNKKELVEIVKYLSELARRIGLEERALWKPSLSPQLDLHQLENCYVQKDQNRIITYLGLLDDPMNQQQYPYVLDLQSVKNMLIIGGPDSGKTTFIQSMLLSLIARYSPGQLNFYIFDYSSRMLKLFKDLPHCGAVLTEEEEDKIEALFHLIQDTVNQRKKLFADMEVDSYDSAAAICEIPLVLVIIDNFAGFTAGKKGADFQYKLHEYLKTCVNYGIIFILSASHLNEVVSRIKQELGTRIALHMNDRYDYGEALGCRCKYEPPEYPGRGLALWQGEPLELQIGKYAAKYPERERIEKIKEQLHKVADYYTEGPYAKRLSVLPQEETYQEFMIGMELGRLPLGYALKDMKKVALPFKQFSMISLYLGNQKGISPVISNILIVAYQNDMEVSIVKRKNRSIFYEDSKVYANPIQAQSVRLIDSSLEAISGFWAELADEVPARREILEKFCDEQGLNPKSPEIWRETYQYMREETTAKLVVFESFADLCSTAEENTNAVFAQIFKLSRKYNMYFLACFYPDDESVFIGHPLMKAFNPEELIMFFGGAMEQQRLASVPLQYTKELEGKTFNHCLMKYNKNIYAYMMPCGPISEEKEALDDRNIFEV